MNPCPILFSAAFVLFAGAVPAQAVDAVGPRQLRVRVADADLAFALIAVDALRMPLFDNHVLADAIALPIRKRDGAAAADLFVPDLAADVYVQILTWNGRLRASAVRRLPARGARDEALVADWADLAAIDATADVADLLVDDIAFERASAHLPMTCHANVTLGRFDSVKIAFTAPSDGYGLKLLAAFEAAPSEVHVHVWRKVPGPDEGLCDVVENHSLRVDFPPARAVKVFVADAIKPPRGGLRLLAAFPQ